MCAICGCGGEHAHYHEHPHAHDQEHPHAYSHGHGHGHGHSSAPHARSLVELEARILAKNDMLAQKNRGWFAGCGTAGCGGRRRQPGKPDLFDARTAPNRAVRLD
jgi:hydrogenase nickel incorporation protein HypB